jgi:hypothetical protein
LAGPVFGEGKAKEIREIIDSVEGHKVEELTSLIA